MHIVKITFFGVPSCGLSHVPAFLTATQTGHEAVLTPADPAPWSLIVAMPDLLSDLRVLPSPKCCAHAMVKGWGVCLTRPLALSAERTWGDPRRPLYQQLVISAKGWCPWCGQASLFTHLPTESRPSLLLPDFGDYEYCCSNYSCVSVCVKTRSSFLQEGRIGLGHVQACRGVTMGPGLWAMGCSGCCPFSICAFLGDSLMLFPHEQAQVMSPSSEKLL